MSLLTFFAHESAEHANKVEAVTDHAASPTGLLAMAIALLAAVIAARLLNRPSDD